MQTLAAIYRDADSYEKLLAVCRKMRLPESDSEEVFRRMAFNILANNTDDHNKNFSFLMDEQGRWRLSPAYDMTYIFNIGGFLPEKMHCLMMQGKLSGQTIDDAMTLAKDNGIRHAEEIIHGVAEAIHKFRSIAEKHGVQERWIAAIESCLSDHLAHWGLANAGQSSHTLNINGVSFEKVHVKQSYKGNYHLYATIDGKERKFVISKAKEEYALIESIGYLNLTAKQLKSMIEKYFIK